MPNYQTLNVTVTDAIAHVELNRPEKRNAMNMDMWEELQASLAWCDETDAVRVVVISGAGPMFCAGIDLSMFAQLSMDAESCEGRKREKIRLFIKKLQDCLTQIEQCRKPVIAAVHGQAIGGALDMLACCDMRYCSQDAVFSIKEIDLGMTADVGSLQRLPYIIGDGIMRELAYTGRLVKAEEAQRIGLVNQVYDDKEAMMGAVNELAATIAAKSPLAMRGTKEAILYTRDHSVADGLNYIATWNAAMIMSEDLQEAMRAFTEQRQPQFKD